MSAMDLNKLVGSVLLSLLVLWVIGFVGNALVSPRAHKAAVTASAEQAAPAAPKAEPVLEKVAPLLASADVKKGAEIFKRCLACHTDSKGGPNKIGPNLWNVVNRPRASESGYDYSKAMKEKSGSWTYADLNHFLAKPRGFVPGTKMGFAGLKKVQERADVIAYLRTQADSPAPLP